MDFVTVIKNNLLKTNSPNVDLVPYFEDFNFFTKNLEKSRFKKALNELKTFYDYILIDCVPFLKAKNLEILQSSNSVIIPVQCDYYALEGLHTFLKTIRHIQKNANQKLEVEGFLLTMYDKRLNLSKKVANYMQSFFKEIVFSTIIHRNTTIARAQSFGKSIVQFDVSSKGAKDYLLLAEEVIARNTLLEKPKEISVFPENHESKFNKKSFKTSISKDKISNLFTVFLKKETKITSEKEEISEFKLDGLVGLYKSEVKRKLGPSNRDFYGNIWMYKLNKRSFFERKYLYIYFTDDVVSHYSTKWFKSKEYSL
ncbi:UNVERIFIED_CONTAM: hypothetical protein GTU68_050207 [Idotea baltica]|nr:hypothetical protein [Idotea baltica]